MSAFTCCPRCGYRADAVLNAGKRGVKPMPIPPDLMEHFKAGETVMQLGVRYGVFHMTARKWLRELGVAKITGNKSPKRACLPACIKEEYERGDTVAAIAGRYQSTLPDVRLKLAELGTKIRKPGKCRLNGHEIAEILALDVAGENHAAIGRQFKVTRERVRQIVAEHGHPSRWSRHIGTVVDRLDEANASKTARDMEKAQRIERANELWKQGEDIEELAKMLGQTSKYVRQKIMPKYRKLGPEWFPYRSPKHWNTNGHGGRP